MKDKTKKRLDALYAACSLVDSAKECGFTEAKKAKELLGKAFKALVIVQKDVIEHVDAQEQEIDVLKQKIMVLESLAGVEHAK